MSKAWGRRGPRCRRAIVLISLSWCVLILSLLLFSRVRSVDLFFESENLAESKWRLRWAARSAANMTLSAMTAEVASGENEFDAYSDSWGWQSLRERFGDVLGQECPGIEIAVWVEDEDSKIDLDGPDPNRTAALLESLGWPKLRAKKLASDMQELARRDIQALSGESASGAEEASLAQLPEGLRFVTRLRDVTPAVLYGEDIDFDGEPDACEDDGTNSYPPDDGDGSLRPGLTRFLTVRGDGVVNPNLAPYEVLLTVPGVSRRIAEEIVSKRSGSDRVEGTRDDFIFKRVEDLMSLSSISQYREIEYSKMAPHMRTTSSCFTIRVCASTHVSSQRSRIQACVKRDGEGKLNVLSWLEDDGF